MQSFWFKQISAGIISGLGLSVFALSCGALLVSLHFSQFLGIAMGSMLISGIVGSCYGLISKDKSLVCGPDANAISVMVASLITIEAVSQSVSSSGELLSAVIILCSITAAISLFLMSHFKLGILIRFIPFSVTAGFLAASGFLMINGASQVIAGIPISFNGINTLINHPFQPELLVGIIIAWLLIHFSKKISAGVLIPIVLFSFLIIINLLTRTGICTEDFCKPEFWFFSENAGMPWIPVWQIHWLSLPYDSFVGIFPSILIAVFVSILTILITLSSIEMTYSQEFELSQELGNHSIISLVCALFGGFIPVLAIARISINKSIGGFLPAGIISGGFALITILGANELLTLVPRACLGGLLMFLGTNLVKTWTLSQREKIEFIEFLQILVIVFVVARYGFLAGFITGIVFACVFFVYTYSKIPVTFLRTDLSVISSSVTRSDSDHKILENHGKKVKVFRLSGYVFFGSVFELDDDLNQLDISNYDCIIFDLTKVTGLDSAATKAFQRIIQRYISSQVLWYFSYPTLLENNIKLILSIEKLNHCIKLFNSFDLANEAAENLLIEKYGEHQEEQNCFFFLKNARDVKKFKEYCESMTVEANETIIHDGDHSDQIFFLDSGEFEVIKQSGEQEIRLAKLKSGSVVGEMAFFNGGFRAASVRSTCVSVVFVLSADSYREMSKHSPVLSTQLERYFIKKLTKSIVQTNKLITSFA